MEELASDKDSFIQALLAERDRLFQKITRYKSWAVATKEKSKPVHRPIPENIPLIDDHIYPENINLKEWIEVKPESTEVLEHKPKKFFVRRIIRHKYVMRNKFAHMESAIITAVLPDLLFWLKVTREPPYWQN